MKVLVPALIVGPSLIAGAAHGELAVHNPLLASYGAIHVVAMANPADRETYLRKKDSKMGEWRSEIGHFVEQTRRERDSGRRSRVA